MERGLRVGVEGWRGRFSEILCYLQRVHCGELKGMEIG